MKRSKRNNKTNKRAQLQSGETVVVIIIISIMIVVGLVFATKTKSDNIIEESTELREIDAMRIAVVASNLNELKCSEYSSMVKTCIDYYRIIAFNETVSLNENKEKEHYYYLLGNSEINIRIIKTDGEENHMIYNYNNSANKSSSPVYIPILVRDTIDKKSYFSIMEIRTYS